MSQATLSGTHLPLPSNPLFQDFQFKIIGKEPALLMRLSNNMDDLDVDDIYEELPLPSGSMPTESVPRGAFSRPTLFQTLASDDELGNAEANVPTASADLVNFSSPPASLQSISSLGPPDIPKLASPPPISPSGTQPLWTSSTAPAFAAGSSTNIQDPGRSDQENRTHTTPSSHPPPIDLVLLPDQALKPIDSFKVLKKVVVLKDKFKAISATARQSQRLARHALINAQRSAAAAQTCLATAQSFVPCVGDVISAIRRMRPGSGTHGPASEWTAVLRDLEDDLYDLKQWSSETFGRGQNLPYLRSIDGMARETCGVLPLTSVEEEAQEALRAWNQLDQKIHENDRAKRRREPGSQMVSPESQQLGIEDGAVNQHQESGTRISKEIVEAFTENVDKDRHHHEGALQPRGGVEENMALEIATEGQGSQNPRDDQMQQPVEESHQSPGSRGEETVPVSMTASSDIRNVASKKTLADCPQPGSASPRRDTSIIAHMRPTSIPQESVSVALPGLHDRDLRNLQSAFTTPIDEEYIEQTPASPSNPVSSDGTQADQQSPLASPLPGEVSVAPRSRVDPSNSVSTSQAHPSTPIPTTYGNSDAVPNGGGELGQNDIPRSEITPGSQTSDRARDVSCTSPVKTESVEPQFKFGVEENRAANSHVSNRVKSTFNTPLKLESETSELSISPLFDECEIGMKPPGRVSPVDLQVPLPNGLPAMKQKPPEAPSSAGTDSVRVITTRLSPHSAANNDVPARPVLSNSPASPSSRGSQLAQLASVPVHSPISPSSVPLALRVEKPTTYANHIRDCDDSISPDLMFSHGWDADENDGSRRGRRRSPNKFSPVPRNQSRDVESHNKYMGYDRSRASLPRGPFGSRPSKSPDGRRPISSYEYPAPLIGKKRPREEVNHSLPPRSRRDWTGTVPSVSEHQMSHVSPVDIRANQRLGPSTSPITQHSYDNLSNSSRHPAPSLINRLDPSTVQIANPVEDHMQRPNRPQPAQTQNRVWQNSGYNTSQPFYGRRGHHGYNNDRPPELLNRLTSSQPFQHGHNTFDSGHSPNVGRPSNRSHGRGGHGGTFQQQRKFPSLYERLDNKP